MQKAMIVYLYLATAVFAMGQEPAQHDTDLARIMSLENAWNQAVLHKDLRALELLMSSELVYVDEDGKRMSQAEYFSNVQSRVQNPVKIVSDSVKVQIYGGAGVVTGNYHESGVNKGKTYELHERFLDVWVRMGGSWVCVASQSTLMPR